MFSVVRSISIDILLTANLNYFTNTYSVSNIHIYKFMSLRYSGKKLRLNETEQQHSVESVFIECTNYACVLCSIALIMHKYVLLCFSFV